MSYFLFFFPDVPSALLALVDDALGQHAQLQVGGATQVVEQDGDVGAAWDVQPIGRGRIRQVRQHRLDGGGGRLQREPARAGLAVDAQAQLHLGGAQLERGAGGALREEGEKERRKY